MTMLWTVDIDWEEDGVDPWDAQPVKDEVASEDFENDAWSEDDDLDELED